MTKARVLTVLAGLASAAGVGLAYTTPPDALAAAQLAGRFENVFFSAGLHPNHAGEWTDQSEFITRLHHLLTLPKLVALGEMGLDRHYPDPPIEVRPAVSSCRGAPVGRRGDRRPRR